MGAIQPPRTSAITITRPRHPGRFLPSATILYPYSILLILPPSSPPPFFPSSLSPFPPLPLPSLSPSFPPSLSLFHLLLSPPFLSPSIFPDGRCRPRRQQQHPHCRMNSPRWLFPKHQSKIWIYKVNCGPTTLYPSPLPQPPLNPPILLHFSFPHLSSSFFLLSGQLRSNTYLHLTLFFIVTSFWANFIVGTIDVQLGDSKLLLTAYEQVPTHSSHTSSYHIMHTFSHIYVLFQIYISSPTYLSLSYPPLNVISLLSYISSRTHLYPPPPPPPQTASIRSILT